MINIKKEMKFNRFIFFNLILIVIIVYGYYIISSVALDSIGSKIFSNVAYRYSADYIFENNKVSSEKLNRIHNLDGWIFIIDEDLILDYISNKVAPNKYSFRDIVDLNKGLYKHNGKKYFGSIKKLSTSDKYGIVVLPSKYIKNQILLCQVHNLV